MRCTNIWDDAVVKSLQKNRGNGTQSGRGGELFFSLVNKFGEEA